MKTNSESQKTEQLLAEADELLRQIDSDVLRDMEETHRMQFEKHAQDLEKIRSGIQSGTGKKSTSETDSGAEGMHEAILDIVRAMRGMKKNFS